MNRSIGVIAISAFMMLTSVGCSTYTLTPTKALTGFPKGATHRIVSPVAVVVHGGSTAAFGFGQPSLELDIQGIPEIGRDIVHSLPVGTLVRIERYVQFNQHGVYCCGSNGWRFAIASIVEGKLGGTRFLIQFDDLKMLENEAPILAPR